MENKKTKNNQSSNAAVERNIEAIVNMEKASRKNLSVSERLAIWVSHTAGSMPFILLHVLWFSSWITVNTGKIPDIQPFDPYPFSFLTLVVSLEAIFLTLLVLMSQNRMSKEADKRAQLDLQINLLDEQETTVILRMVHKISHHLGIQDDIGNYSKDLAGQTDISTLAKRIDENSEEN